MKLIAYDIADAKRLRKVAKLCELYGLRIEKSLFECSMPDKLFTQFWNELKDIVAENEDAVIAYDVTDSQTTAALCLGTVKRPGKGNCFICGC